MDIAVQVYNLTSGLPRSEDYGLTSQIRRSALSISANIAEGFGRNTNADKARYYVMSRGSAFETRNHLLYGERVRYFEPNQVKTISEQIEIVIYESNKLIKTLTQPQP